MPRNQCCLAPGLALIVLVTASCSEKGRDVRVDGLPSIEGKAEYLESPFVTAGDRLYMIGHQDGSFPDLGWHVEGEMGGVWNHPVKLMDGFTSSVSVGAGNHFCLDNAVKFLNFPVGNQHEFHWPQEQLKITRFQFVPDSTEGMIVDFEIQNESSEDKEIGFSFTGLSDLRPTWLGDRTNMVDGRDKINYEKAYDAFIASDELNPWYAVFGSSRDSDLNSKDAGPCGVSSRKGQGTEGTLSYSLRVASGGAERIRMFIAGSYRSEEDARSTYTMLKEKVGTFFERKVARYEKIDARSRLTIPDKEFEEMYRWLKYNTDWLVRHVPEQGLALGAGLPDYPWWFGADMAYALQGVLATGDHELTRNSIVTLSRISEAANANGRIIHEVSTNGAVYNPGNVNETAQFISLLYDYLQWTGDVALVKELFPQVRKGISWLLSDMDPDGNGYPNGSGMMEIPGLDSEMIDVAVYTQQALSAASHMARILGDHAIAADYGARADSLRQKINDEWWNADQQSFGDFRGTVAEAAPIVRAARIRADTLKKPWAVRELDEVKANLNRYEKDAHIPHVVYHNWVVNTPMETGVADSGKGRAALVTARKYENPFGVFVTGIDRTEEEDSVVLKSRKKTFSYTGAVMTLPTGVQAVAAARYGTADDALYYLGKLQRSFSYALPGSMYEVSPDFGMVTQAWNIYGVAVPIVRFFFGIQPRAFEKTIRISPDFPKAWKEGALENVRVGDNSIGISIAIDDDRHTYKITQTIPEWQLKVNVGEASRIKLDGREMKLPEDGDEIVLKGSAMTLEIFRE